MLSTRRASTRAALVACGVCLALVAGCGNRVDHERVVAVGNGYGPVDAARNNQGAVVPGAAAPGTGAVAADVPAPGALAADVSEATASVVTAPGTADRVAAPAGSKSVAAADRTVATQAQAATCTAPLAPIVLGQTLASSGLVGAAIAGLRTGLAVWAKDVNSRGGVQCHPVQLIQLDDGSDAARVSANWNSMVHDRGAVAIVASGAPVANAALRTAAERDKVPVVGGDLTTVDWLQSPYLFSTGGSPLTAYDGSVIDASKAIGGAVKAGMVYCVEASICTSLRNNFPKSVERAGVELGPVIATSLTQPDFTAECQQLKSAGVNLLWVGLDGSAAIRAVRSCSSLNYTPVIATGSIAVSAAAAADNGLRRNTMYLGTQLVPYTVTDSPAVKAFTDAMRRYAPSAVLEQNALFGWAAGKLFEASLANVADKARAGTVTTAMILEGLWKVKTERLDGLSPGVTFSEGKPAANVDCYYGLKLDVNGFSAVSGSKPTCFGASKRLEKPAAQAPVPDTALGRQEQPT
ncbi:hypothetical protein GCM10009547_08630 [Sporichthya brevicatena]|uniref:Leucine-binding protein domain-containing protein n=1 Tax=Sporichthya brevicatena TaxID=171442 RepID=A0ABP3REP8_9ACTN